MLLDSWTELESTIKVFRSFERGTVGLCRSKGCSIAQVEENLNIIVIISINIISIVIINIVTIIIIISIVINNIEVAN